MDNIECYDDVVFILFIGMEFIVDGFVGIICVYLVEFFEFGKIFGVVGFYKFFNFDEEGVDDDGVY